MMVMVVKVFVIFIMFVFFVPDDELHNFFFKNRLDSREKETEIESFRILAFTWWARKKSRNFSGILYSYVHLFLMFYLLVFFSLLRLRISPSIKKKKLPEAIVDAYDFMWTHFAGIVQFVIGSRIKSSNLSPLNFFLSLWFLAGSNKISPKLQST